MGSLIKPAFTATGAALGGPAGAALGGFLGTTLTGGNFEDSLKGAAGGAVTGAAGGAGGAAGSQAASSGLDKFKGALGFGDNNWLNMAKGGEMIAGSIPKVGELPPLEFMPQTPSLLEVLKSRRY